MDLNLILIQEQHVFFSRFIIKFLKMLIYLHLVTFRCGTSMNGVSIITHVSTAINNRSLISLSFLHALQRNWKVLDLEDFPVLGNLKYSALPLTVTETLKL